jgi:hypothetical protein
MLYFYFSTTEVLYTILKTNFRRDGVPISHSMRCTTFPILQHAAKRATMKHDMNLAPTSLLTRPRIRYSYHKWLHSDRMENLNVGALHECTVSN